LFTTGAWLWAVSVPRMGPVVTEDDPAPAGTVVGVVEVLAVVVVVWLELLELLEPHAASAADASRALAEVSRFFMVMVRDNL
jgi:hypothetical protein